MKFKKIKFKNGLNLLFIPEKRTQGVAILVLVKTGSRYETKKTMGISHFLEHMFFKGTKKRPTPVKLAEVLDRVGGIYNAFTSQEYTGYWAKVEKSHFELALDWIADIFFNSILPKKEIEKEKRVIIQEINMIYDDPAIYVGNLWLSLLYKDQPAGWPITGTSQSVSALKRKDLINYKNRQYVAQNTLITIAGNFSQKRALNLIKKYFRKIKKGEPFLKPKIKEIQRKPQVLLEERKTSQTHFWLGTRGYHLFSPQKYPFQILALILGGMMSSRLFVKLREKLALCYYISTSAESNPDSGYLVVKTGVKNEKVEKAIREILKELRKIKERGVSLSELKKAKENVCGKLTLTLESSDALASFYGIQQLLENRILTLKEILGKIKEVKRRDILKVAREIFKNEKLNLALIGPFRERNRFLKILKL